MGAVCGDIIMRNLFQREGTGAARRIYRVQLRVALLLSLSFLNQANRRAKSEKENKEG